MSFKSPLGRVLGQGSHSGTQHWISQRITSVALAVLGPWLVVSLLTMPDFSYASAHAAMARPANAVVTILFLLAAFHHAYSGVTVVIEDYVPAKGKKILALLVLQFLHVAFAVAGIIAVLRLAIWSAV
ncbi:MAG: succinate dehydrogenase, hydrophobic membrane anchor protein [Pseudomonadota bacterium]